QLVAPERHPPAAEDGSDPRHAQAKPVLKSMPGSVAINGVRFDLVPRADLAGRIAAYLEGGPASSVVHFLPAHPTVLARRDESYPGICVAGAIAPPFRTLTADELDADADAIRASNADLLWIGLGTPRQDFVAESLRATGCARVILAVGAVFDFASGTRRRAPR